MNKIKRPKAGQPQKYNEESTTIAFRVPKSKKDHYKKVVRLIIEATENKDLGIVVKNNI